ncbi:MAG: tetratricopeptide repeat protein [Chloroflexi bacterium]|nr:tetratricopeptide repeat protein [Chloroflexota bacterium]
MRIRRDYSQPFFRRQRRWRWHWLAIYALLVGGFLFYVDLRFFELQYMALDAVGQAPPPTPFASELATQGMQAFARGDVQAAGELLGRAVAQQPNNIDYLYEYGLILLELGVEDESYYQEAIAIGDRARAANPGDPRGYALQTRAKSLAGQANNAVPDGQAGLQVDRNFAPLHAALSDAYRRIDRYELALEAAEQAIELDPLDPTARRIYAYALIWVGRRDEAIDQLEQAVGLNPNIAGPYFELAAMYLNEEEPALAIATYEDVLAMQPENARAYLRICEAYTRVGQHQLGQDYCEDALEIRNEEYPQAWRGLGQVRYARRNYEGAIDAFERCVELGSDEIECFYLRGLAHFYLGHCDDAWNILSDSVGRLRATLIGPEADNPVLQASLTGLQLVRENCTGYGGFALPTPIPPTPIPPTPIGG